MASADQAEQNEQGSTRADAQNQGHEALNSPAKPMNAKDKQPAMMKVSAVPFAISGTVTSSLSSLIEAINTSASLKDQLQALEAKLDEAKRKRSSLVARQRAAQARHSMTKIDATFQEGLAAHANFTRMEDKVAEMEARSQAVAEVYQGDSVEQEFLDLEAQAEVDAELEALKRELDGGDHA